MFITITVNFANFTSKSSPSIEYKNMIVYWVQDCKPLPENFLPSISLLRSSLKSLISSCNSSFCLLILRIVSFSALILALFSLVGVLFDIWQDVFVKHCVSLTKGTQNSKCILLIQPFKSAEPITLTTPNNMLTI